ncbi:MAG: N-acetylglucosamine kinase [Bryobacteraceae bacterium]|jgi:N-acetylglucosamine kinase
MKLFLGIDGGQSETAALIGDETGRVLGHGEAGPCNHAAAAEGRAKLERAISDSVAWACAQAGLDPEAVEFEAACCGMSGGPDDKEGILADLLRARKLVVTTDAAIALAGATSNGQGIIVIAGTGSIAMGRDGQGRTARAGGWGYVLGDEGGAFDIARQAVRAALRMEEGWGPATALVPLLLEATGSRSASQLLHQLYGAEWPRPRAARLAPLVDQAAEEGDAVAASILNGAAQDLATLAAAVRGQLWTAAEAVEVAHIGGVFESRRVLERFRMLVELEPRNRSIPPLHSPAEGALREAWRMAGIDAWPGE